MHRSGSHTGISAASLRFSYFVVPFGKVPSIGIADTGSRSPLPGDHRHRDTVDEVRSRGHGCCDECILSLVGLLDGTATSASSSSARSTAAWFFSTISRPRRPYASTIDCFTAAIASVAIHHVDQGEEAGLHHRVDPARHAQIVGDPGRVDREHLELPLDDLALNRRRQMAPDLVGRIRGVQQERPALTGPSRGRRTGRAARTGGRRRGRPPRRDRSSESDRHRTAGATPSSSRTSSSRRRSSPVRGGRAASR